MPQVFNEPHVMTVDQLNAMNTAVLPVIRRHHPTRVVFIGGLQFMNPTWILANPNAMHLFPNDSYVALEVGWMLSLTKPCGRGSRG